MVLTCELLVVVPTEFPLSIHESPLMLRTSQLNSCFLSYWYIRLIIGMLIIYRYKKANFTLRLINVCYVVNLNKLTDGMHASL
jgi:hypothetical protein